MHIYISLKTKVQGLLEFSRIYTTLPTINISGSHKGTYIKYTYPGAREMAKWLSTLVVLLENLGSQHPHGDLQQTITQVPRSLMLCRPH